MTEPVTSPDGGFTLVRRIGKATRVHRFWPSESCNTDDAPYKVRLSGDWSVVDAELRGRKVSICKRCFRG